MKYNELKGSAQSLFLSRNQYFVALLHYRNFGVFVAVSLLCSLSLFGRAIGGITNSILLQIMKFVSLMNAIVVVLVLNLVQKR